MVLDHEHCLSKEKPGDNGKGCCRGVIHKNANVIEGKINNVFKRWGGQKETDLISFLENLLEYYKHNRSSEEIIHPTEAKKLKKIKPIKPIKQKLNKQNPKNKKSRVRITKHS